MTPTRLALSAPRSKAQVCLHWSHGLGGPQRFSELVQRWQRLPMNAAMMLQNSHARGCPMNQNIKHMHSFREIINKQFYDIKWLR